MREVANKAGGPFLLAGIVTGALYWVLGSEIHAYIFPGHNFLNHLMTPPLHEIWMRVIIIVLIILFGASAQYIMNRLKQEKDVIKFAQIELDQIFNTAADGMRLINKDFTVLKINDTLSKMLGVNREDAIGKKCFETFHGSLCQTLDCPLNKILRGERYIECDVEKEGQNGIKIHCIVTATPFKSLTGELVGIVEDIKDITKRKKVEKENRLLMLILNKRLKELNCLYGISRIDEHYMSLEKIIQEAVKIISSSLKHSNMTNPKIIFEDYEYTTHSPQQSECTHSEPIKVHGNVKGSLEISYREKDRGSDKDLIKIIAKRIGEIIERKQAEEELIKHRDHLEHMVNERTVELKMSNEQLKKEIAERKEVEKKLQGNRDRLAKAQEIGHIGDWEWDITEGTITWSDEVYRLFGYEPKAVDITYDIYRDRVYPDDFIHLNMAIHDTLKNGNSYEIEYRIITNHGEERILFSQGIVERDKEENPRRLYGTVQDITMRKRTEKALRESEERFRKIFEQAAVGMVYARPDGRFLKVNQRFCTMVGYTQNELLELTFEQITHPEDLAIDLEHHEKLLHDTLKTYSIEKRYYHKNGSIIWANLTVSLVREQSGNPKYLMGMIEDITERKKMEKEAREKQEQLIQADKLASLGTLVTGVAHEINNPNQFIMSNTPFLRRILEGALPILNNYYGENGDFIIGGLHYSHIRDDILNCLNDIADGAIRIDRIVKELKNFARKDPHRQFTLLNINQIVQSAISLTSTMLKKSTRNFTFLLDENLPMIQGNSQRLEQVVINLIQNACHALTNRTQGIFILTYQQKDKGTVTIEVKDEGTGIPHRNLKKIKDPFFTTKREQGGTGLGLSVSQTIINEHNGRLNLSSQEGQGTTAQIILSARKEYYE
ncbi:MAG: PAS domain S-box protein [bacterium]